MRERMLWVLVICLAYAGVQLGFLGTAAVVDCEDGAYADLEGVCRTKGILSAESILKLQSLPHTVTSKYLGKCKSLADLDLYGTNVELCYGELTYKTVVVQLPYDIEYMKKIRNDNTLSNSIGSLVSSGILRVVPETQYSPSLVIVIDIGYVGTVEFSAGRPREISCTSFTSRGAIFSDMAESMCGDRFARESVNSHLDDIIGLFGEKDVSEISAIYGVNDDGCMMSSLSRDIILMDFVRMYNKEQVGKMKLSEEKILPFDIGTGISPVDHDNIRALNYYVDYINYREDGVSAAFYVPHVDGKDTAESLGSYFAVTGLLADLKRYTDVRVEKTDSFKYSVFNSHKGNDISITKTDVVQGVRRDDPFKELFEVIWNDGIKPGSQLIGRNRDIPYKAGGGFGGFVIVMPVHRYIDSCRW